MHSHRWTIIDNDIRRKRVATWSDFKPIDGTRPFAYFWVACPCGVYKHVRARRIDLKEVDK